MLLVKKLLLFLLLLLLAPHAIIELELDTVVLRALVINNSMA